MLVHFPIALLCFAFLLDGAAWLWKSQPARSAGLYALVAGAVMAALAVVSGLITPEAREREGRRLAEGSFSLYRFFSGRLVEVHKHWSYVLLALVVLWLVVRVASHLRSARWHGLSLAIGVLALIALVLTGYYGGGLVYGRRGRERGQVVLPHGIATAEAAARLGVAPAVGVPLPHRPDGPAAPSPASGDSRTRSRR